MRILLAIDNSKFSEAATRAVITQYQRPETEIKVLHVIDLGKPIPTPYAERFRQQFLRQGEELVAGVAKLLRAEGLNVVTAVEEGDPKTRIIDNLVRWQADLAVLGSHGRIGLEHFLIGSVAEAVARHAPCSVEIVRLGSPSSEAAS